MNQTLNPHNDAVRARVLAALPDGCPTVAAVALAGDALPAAFKDDPDAAAAARDVVDAAVDAIAPVPVSADVMWDAEDALVPVPTGLASLDVFLGGGWRPGRIYEVAGVPGAGKTELLYASAAAAVSTSHDATVLWIDAALGFVPRRMARLVADPRDLARIHVARCPHMAQLHASLRSPPSNLRLIVVDSVHAYLAPLLGDPDDHVHLLSHALVVALRDAAVRAGAAVVLANAATKWDARVKPALGAPWRALVDDVLVLEEVAAADLADSEGSDEEESEDEDAARVDGHGMRWVVSAAKATLRLPSGYYELGPAKFGPGEM
ncbi:DNA repair protein rad51d [Blastocladiella emersonii ATCC 22665]|nr:DNA repair protein rad51d [Blastocladiella emersonii ATCC 22665]